MGSSYQSSVKGIEFVREDRVYEAALCRVQVVDEALFFSDVDQVLHPKEKEYFDQVKGFRKRSFLLGRLAAKLAVCELMGEVEMTAIFIDRGVFKFPVVSCVDKQCPQVCITHTESMAIAVAFPEAHPIGIDMEFDKESRYKAIKKYATLKELKDFDVQAFSSRYPYTLLWTIKESLSKAIKTGLMASFSVYEVKDICFNNGCFESYFSNFIQYKACSWVVGTCCFSMTVPKYSEVDVGGIGEWVNGVFGT